MTPIPGMIYAGRSGKPRKVVRLENERRVLGYHTYDVVYQTVLGHETAGYNSVGPLRLGTPRQCWCQTWFDWVRAPIEEHQA